jgi:hypothetical protein
VYINEYSYIGKIVVVVMNVNDNVNINIVVVVNVNDNVNVNKVVTNFYCQIQKIIQTSEKYSTSSKTWASYYN